MPIGFLVLAPLLLLDPPLKLDYEISIPCERPVGSQFVVPFSGLLAHVHASLSEVLSTFPTEWDGRPRVAVGLDVMPTGFRLRFAERTRVLGLLTPRPPERLVFFPPEVADIGFGAEVEVDSIVVNWDPIPGREESREIVFPGDCAFVLWVDREVLVVAEGLANLAATYALPGDTVQVWGGQVGMGEIWFHGQGLTRPVDVEPCTWGRIKALHGSSRQ